MIQAGANPAPLSALRQNRGRNMDEVASTPDGTRVNDGLSRREVLRRGAALGAALAVTAPVVQSLGQLPAFAQATPPPGDDPRPVSYPSNFQVLFTIGGAATTKYGIKYEPEIEGWARIGAGNPCWDPQTFSPASDQHISDFNSFATVTKVSDQATGKGSFVLDVSGLPADYQIYTAATFDGQATGGYSGKCELPIVPGGDGKYEFAKP